MRPADEQEGARLGRKAALVVAPFVLGLVAAVVAYLLLRDALPNQLATHFGFSGADGYSSSGSALASYLVVYVIEAVLFLVWAMAGDEEDGTLAAFRLVGALAWAAAAATTYLLCAVLKASTKSASGQDVSIPLYHFFIALAVGAVVLLVGRYLSRRH